MHGNACEWCRDSYDATWYEKSPTSDPIGPNESSKRVVRGGHFYCKAFKCRSAGRFSSGQSNSREYHGFRIVRPLDPTTLEAGLATTATTPAVAPATPTKPWETPAFQQWIKDVQALPAEKQVEAVSKKLMELNPGFDGRVTGAERKGTPKIENGVVTTFGFVTDNVSDISPVRVLNGLDALYCNGSPPGKSKLSDLSPLRGLSLKKLDLRTSSVSDLSPLEGMKLTSLIVSGVFLSDLAPLRGMPLTGLDVSTTRALDLSPLSGMPLKSLHCNASWVPDISPLEGMNLEAIFINPRSIGGGMDAIRQMKSLALIGIDATTKLPPAEFWKKYDAGEFDKPVVSAKPWESPAFQQWMKDVQALPAEKQVEAVSKKLMELNPGFDGKVTGVGGRGTPRIEKGVVTELGVLTDNVIDISPVRAFAGLKELGCGGKSRLSDLWPLEGMKLTFLDCHSTLVSDLLPLRGLPLTNLDVHGTAIADLSPLRGMALKIAHFGTTQISDLSPLQGMPLGTLYCDQTQVTDLSPLQGCKSLGKLYAVKIKVTPAAVAALQKALPKCKIEWDDPAKPKTPAPAPAVKK
jgi:Leucine-rich repeat (LRR) protein